MGKSPPSFIECYMLYTVMFSLAPFWLRKFNLYHHRGKWQKTLEALLSDKILISRKLKDGLRLHKILSFNSQDMSWVHRTAYG